MSLFAAGRGCRRKGRLSQAAFGSGFFEVFIMGRSLLCLSNNHHQKWGLDLEPFCVNKPHLLRCGFDGVGEVFQVAGH